MRDDAMLFFLIGLLLAFTGLASRGYMDFCLRRHNRHRGWRYNTEAEYMRLIKDRQARRWPLYTSIVLTPIGIIMVFGAIVYNNHMRLK
jgi:hypothetical protein